MEVTMFCRPEILGTEIPPGLAVDGVEDRDLAAGDQQLAQLSGHWQIQQGLFEHPVKIPNVAIEMLIVPNQLSAIGIERDGGSV